MLVERTVEDVVPSLTTNAEGLKGVLADLVKTYKGREAELEKWKASFSSSFGLIPVRVRRGLGFWGWVADFLCRRRTIFRLCRPEEGCLGECEGRLV